MNAPGHSCKSQRGAALLVVALFFGSGCRGYAGCASAPGGARTEAANDGAQLRPMAADRAAASSAGSRAIRALDERCAPRAAGGGPVMGQKGSAAVTFRPIGKLVEKADECVRSTDCAARPYGRCAARAEQTNFYHGTAVIVPAHTECLYDECTSDAECRARGEHEPRAELVCHCDVKERNTCTFANCRTDADCPAPYACGSYQYCHSAADECQKPSDCTGGHVCTYSWEKRLYLCVARQLPMPG